MPRKNQKSIGRRGVGGLPPETDLEQILHGDIMLDGFKPSASDAELWAMYGKTIMSLQGVECHGAVPWHSHKGTFFDFFERPALWWTCGPGADEPRRLVDGDPDQALPGRGLSRGKPSCYRAMKHGCVYESERDYLIRRNLLTAAEKKILNDEAVD